MTELLEQIELGWRYDPLEARNAHGEWTKGGVGYAKPDPSRFIIPNPPKNTRFPYYRTPEDHPFFKAHPVSAANVTKVFDAASPEEKSQGMRWYADAGTLASAIAHGDQQKGAGMLAAYSPQTAWPVNMFNAAKAIELGRALGPGDGMITRAMQTNAQEALDGVPLDQNFGKNAAPKIRAFAHLIANGGDTPDDTMGNVVIDRHAMSVAMAERLPKAEADKAPIGTDRYYQYVADTYRNAALAINARGGEQVTPHQVQAITWLHQQAANAAQDEAGAVGHGGKGAGAGRQQMIRNAWQKWDTEASTEGFPVNYGTTALAGGLLGQILELAGWEHELRGRHGEWVSVENTAGARQEIGKQLDEQGLAKDSPLRGVLQHGVTGNRLMLHRDPATGHIDAGTRYSFQKRRTTQTHSIEIKDVRALNQRQGTGSEMLRQIARAHPEAKDMAVFGAVENAKPWYAKNGATFTNGFSSIGEWSPQRVQALRSGGPVRPGKVVTPGASDQERNEALDELEMAGGLLDQIELVNARAHATASATARLHYREDELRDRHGRWTRGAAESVEREPGTEGEGKDDEVSKSIIDAWRGETNPAIKDELNKAGASWDAGDKTGTVDHLRAASQIAMKSNDFEKRMGLFRISVQAKASSEADQERKELMPAMAGMANRAASIVPDLLTEGAGGAAANAWNGKVQIFPDYRLPGVLGEMGWDQTMKIQATAAANMKGDLETPGRPVADVQDHIVIMHEMIHAVVPPSDADRKADQKAYQDYPIAQIEEGFTQLATTHHAAEYMKRMGLGDRSTNFTDVSSVPVTSPEQMQQLASRVHLAGINYTMPAGVDPDLEAAETALKNGDVKTAADKLTDAANRLPAGHPARSTVNTLSFQASKMLDTAADPNAKHFTLAEYADRMADPGRVSTGDSWGIYPTQTKNAQDWVQLIAQQEGLKGTTPGTPGYNRAVQLSDEINRQGAAAKTAIMAEQMMRTEVTDPKLRANPQFMANLSAEIQKNIHDAWSTGQPGSAQAAFQGAQRVASVRVQAAQEQARVEERMTQAALAFKDPLLASFDQPSAA